MIFQIQLITSFIVGGLFIALQTLIAERVPALWRGIVLTFPSTMAIGLLFIGLAKTPYDVIETATILPIALSVDYLFVAVFSYTVRFGLWLGLFFALFSWLFSGALILYFPPNTFLSSAFFGILFVSISYLMVRSKSEKVDLKKFPMNTKHIVLRSIIGGSIVTLILFLSKTLGNVWGGLFSAFPASFSSTFIIYYYLQGKEVIPSVSKSLFFPGSLVLMIYALAMSLSVERFGIWVSTVISYLVVFIFVVGWTFLIKRQK